MILKKIFKKLKLNKDDKKNLIFLLFEAEFCNYDINMKLLIDFIYKKYRKTCNITIYNKHKNYDCKEDIKYFSKYNHEFIEKINNADYIFCSFYQDIIKIINYLEKNPRCKIINIWHGMPIHNICALNEHESKECSELIFHSNKNLIQHIVTSEFYQKFFCKAFNTTKNNIHILGNIRESVVFNNSKVASKYIKEISKDIRFNKIVIYCPTYSSSTQKNIFMYDDYNIDAFNNFLKENQILFLYKKHDSENLKFECTRSNFIELDNNRLKELNLVTQELFSHVDMLITDASSILIDFLLCDLPIILCDTPIHFRENIGLIFEDILKCGYISHNQKDLLNNMIKELKNDNFSKKRHEILNKTCAYKDGETLKRITQLCNLNGIETSNGIVKIKAKDFSEPTKYLNLDVAKKNLLDLKKVMDQSGVKFGLIYGTLLGAYRENNFIKHDYDTDLYVLEEVKQDLLDALPKLINIGFEVCRYDGSLLSVSRDDEYIDFYIFRKSKFFYRKNNVGLSAKATYLENTVDYNFLGESFQIPKNVESFLVYLYGTTWNTPIENPRDCELMS